MLNETLALNSNESFSLHSSLDFNYFNQNSSYDSLASNLYQNTSDFNYLNDASPLLTNLIQGTNFPSGTINKTTNNFDVLGNIKRESIVPEQESRNVFHCEFCNKVTQRNHFKGRFCSKICIGRFAVKYIKNLITN